jgi:DNA-binding NtrC family response regulator
MEQCDALVVHDDQNLRDSLHQAFRAAGYKSVLEANDGGEGLEAFRRARPSLVVTDITTPIAGGLDLLRQIRQEEPDTAVIVLSSRPDAKTAIASLKLGAFAFLPKPVNLEEFLITAQRAARTSATSHRAPLASEGPRTAPGC